METSNASRPPDLSTPDSANPIEGPYRSEWEGLADVLFAIAIGLMLAWGLYHYFGG